MIINLRQLFAATPLLLVCGTTLFIARGASAAEKDPTTPSLPISQLLAGSATSPEPTTTSIEATPSSPPTLRLKALIYRDHENATAIIASADSDLFVVPLRRSELQSPHNQIEIGGMRLMIKDFSEWSVVVQDLDTQRQTTIR